MEPASLTVHGVLLAIDGLGVLLMGASGSGKSELALELVTRGHRLVADDAVECHRQGDRVQGRCPPLLAGFIQVRGLGILNLGRLYGDGAVATETGIDLVIALDATGDLQPEQRLQGRRSMTRLLDIELPTVSLPWRVGHNLAVLVEAACRDHRQRLAGYDASTDLIDRQQRLIATEPN